VINCHLSSILHHFRDIASRIRKPPYLGLSPRHRRQTDRRQTIDRQTTYHGNSRILHWNCNVRLKYKTMPLPRYSVLWKTHCGAAARGYGDRRVSLGTFVSICANGKPFSCFLERAQLRTLHLGRGWTMSRTCLPTTHYPERERTPATWPTSEFWDPTVFLKSLKLRTWNGTWVECVRH